MCATITYSQRCGIDDWRRWLRLVRSADRRDWSARCIYCQQRWGGWGVPTRSFRTLSRLRCRANGCHPVGKGFFSQNIVHEVYHVASCHSDAVAHEFASTVPFRLGVGFESFHQPLGFLSQDFRDAVRDIGFYMTYFSVSAASPSARSLCIVTHVGCCARISVMSL